MVLLCVENLVKKVDLRVPMYHNFYRHPDGLCSSRMARYCLVGLFSCKDCQVCPPFAQPKKNQVGLCVEMLQVN
jgi:hypothetical protein